MTKSGEFVIVDGCLVWQETRTHELSETGHIYLCHKPGDEPHLVYKLCMEPDRDDGKSNDKPAKYYFWNALWNTCCCTGHKTDKPSRFPGGKRWQHRYKTIREAVQRKIDDGWQVRQAYFGDLFGPPLFQEDK